MREEGVLSCMLKLPRLALEHRGLHARGEVIEGSGSECTALRHRRRNPRGRGAGRLLEEAGIC